MKQPFYCLIICLFLFTTLIAQKEDRFGKLTLFEKDLKTYDKDPEASAVVLYEKGDNYFEIIRGKLQLVKQYHGKIKILNKSGLDEALIQIPYYQGKHNFEEVKDIKAITHNGATQTFLRKDQIFTVDVNERWFQKKFSFADAKVGSVLEYSYKIISPFIYDFNGWQFQSDKPKIYSEFNAKIPGNYKYNKRLVGSLNLSVNESSIKDNCIYLKSISEHMSCEVLKYAMKDIPAFKAEEEYMLALSNYISRLDFELAELYRLDGSKEIFTRSWADVDKEFRTDQDIGRQLGKESFYDKNMSLSIFEEQDPMLKAKNIYEFTRNHFVWNGEYGIYKDIDVKKAFEDKTGNIGEININLINLLNMADLKANLVLLSTRANGLPKKVHPVISDFNYILAKVEVDGKSYLLDASDKLIPFGMLPFRCLNYDARVMDFEEESYWYTVKSYPRNKKISRIDLNLDPEKAVLYGTLEEISVGHDAVKKKRMVSTAQDEYLNFLEQSDENELTISDYDILDELDSSKKMTERYNFEIELQSANNKYYIDPFIIKYFKKNPFNLNSRSYPIDFGYNRNHTYYFRFLVPDGMIVKDIPESRSFALPGNTGILKFNCAESEGIVNLYFSLILKSPHYSADAYQMIKELFTRVVEIQNNSLIVLESVTN